MTGILSRYLSGTGTDPLTQKGGMEGYLSQFNVDPYWQQYLQAGQNQSGLLGTLAQQNYTQGGKNPYYQPEQPQAAAPKQASNLDGVKISGFLGTQLAGKHSGQGYKHDAVTLSNGMTIPMAQLNEYITSQQRANPNWVGMPNGPIQMLLSGIASGKVGASVSPEVLKALGYGG